LYRFFQNTVPGYCPGLAACGQIGTVLARPWDADMRCKNRVKRVYGVNLPVLETGSWGIIVSVSDDKDMSSL